MTKRILITGTHLTPALELIRQLQQDPKITWHISYIGRQSNSNDPNNTSIESKIIPALGINFYPIPCGKLDRRYLPNTITGLPKTIIGFFQSLKLINQIKPDIVVSFGGYVSVPVIINAALKKIKTITHEQTLTNSLTTKINSHFVTKVALSFNNKIQISQLPKKKITITGNLLRHQLFHPAPLTNQKLKFKDKNKPLIYITAGNQGSHHINMVIKNNLDLLQNYNIIHQTGENDLKIFKKILPKYSNYVVSDYFDTDFFSQIINQANIVISRSGANTSQEIVALNKMSILIPLPKSQQNEQLLNALWVKENLPHQTVIINDDQLTFSTLINAIKQLLAIKINSNQVNASPNLKLLNLIHEII